MDWARIDSSSTRSTSRAKNCGAWTPNRISTSMLISGRVTWNRTEGGARNEDPAGRGGRPPSSSAPPGACCPPG
jgi:hypothetical protein